MSKRTAAIALLLALLVMSALVAGCGNGGKESDGTDGDKTQDSVTSQSEDIKVGEEFKVELESNPTTGFDWKMTTAADSTILGLTQDSYELPKSSAAGAPGMRTWRFMALKAGSTKMVFEYARSWEADEPPAQTHNVSVVVR